MYRKNILNRLAVIALQPDRIPGTIQRLTREEAEIAEITYFEFIRAVSERRRDIPAPECFQGTAEPLKGETHGRL